MYLSFGFLLKELLLCTKSLFVSFEFAYLTVQLFNLKAGYQCSHYTMYVYIM
jgi:hypothetical protein